MTDAREIIRTWPADPAERLRSILDIYGDGPDDRVVLMATYDKDAGHEIGLTMGDLRAIAERVGA